MKIEMRQAEYMYDLQKDRESLIVSEKSGESRWIDADGLTWQLPVSVTSGILTIEKKRHDLEIRAGELIIEKNDLVDKLRVSEGKVVALTQAASMRPAAQILEAKESTPPIDPVKFIELLTSSVERIAGAVRGPLTPGPSGP